jgi:hypothetical protein
MANCSIPNSTPATGRTSTRSSKRSKKQSSASACFFADSSLSKTSRSWAVRFFNVQRSTPNVQRSVRLVGRWALDACSRFIGVGRWTFSSIWRVRGAWWPSRSSKPSSPRKWRGRFDSYPLRGSRSIPVAVSLRKTRASPAGRRLQQPQWERG